MRKIFTCSLLCLLTAVLAAADTFSPKKTSVAAAYAKKAPAVDGIIGENEYAGGFQQFGFLKHNSGYLSSRQGTFYAALTKDYLYLACRSEVPDADSKVKLKKRYKKRDSAIFLDDSVEFLIMPPNGGALYHMIINPADKTYDVQYPVVNGGVSVRVRKDWNPAVVAKSKITGKYWDLEVRIPLKDMDMKKPVKDGASWLFQFARSWRFPSQQCAFNQVGVFANPDEMTPVRFYKNTPVVRFTGLGEDYAKGQNQITFVVDNPTNKAHRISCRVAVTSEAAPRQVEREFTVQPGKREKVELNYTERSKVTNDIRILFTDADKGNILLKRNFSWSYPIEKRWIAPDVRVGVQLEFGVYPYHNKVCVRLGNQGNPLHLAKVASARMYLTDAKGAMKGNAVTPVKVEGAGFTAELPLNLTAKGDYYIVAEVKGKDGKVQTYKEKFKFERFAWEHNQIGLDRIVVKPYTNLIYKGNSVKTLMAEYTLNNGFFSAVSAGKAGKLLAAPVTLKINGKTPVQQSEKWIEKSNDLGIHETALKLDDLQLKVRNELEFDNFVKTTVTFTPEKAYKFRNMTLEIPLNTAFARQIHSTCNTMKYNIAATLPDKDGELWNSKQGKIHTAVSNAFRPYIWLGNMAEGLSFFTESDKDWSRKDNTPMASVVRKGNVTYLRIYLMNQPCVRSKPFTLTFGFQASPCRPKLNAGRQLTERFSAPNSLTMSLLAGGGCWACNGYDFWPMNRDYSFLNYLDMAQKGKLTKEQQAKIAQDHVKKHFTSFPKDRQAFFQRHFDRGFAYARSSKLLVPYLNPRATHLRWPEYQVFMDEWFCSEYRANNEDDYNNTPTKSYQDFLLACCEKLVDEGLDGIYYDNIRDWHNPNQVVGPAYTMKNGKVQPYFDIFDMRALIKRTAIMLSKKGHTIFDGRPMLVLHMTNTNLLPFTSLGSVCLDLEDKYGSMDFQERFTEDYLTICTSGLQSGAIPEVLVQITGKKMADVTRTFLAVTMAFDLPMVLNAGGVTNVWFVTWRKLKNFGYGTDKVKTFPSYQPSGFVTTDAPKVRITEYRHANGETVLAVCSFGYAGKVTLKFNNAVKEIVDYENNKVLSKPVIDLKKNDFRLIKVK